MPSVASEQFESLEKQAYAARLGMWVFLASEMLFFSGFFALYAAYRMEHPVGFGVGVAHNTVVYGSTNTAVLLVSSYFVALAVHELREQRRGRSALWVGATVLLGLCFLAIKASEYVAHFHEGIYPAGHGRFFDVYGDRGTKMFFNLYFCMTGLHAVHVIVGLGVLGVTIVRIWRGNVGAHALTIAAMYWHFVDIVWIFLWPLFYLIPGGAR